jgi:hypothetical protein
MDLPRVYCESVEPHSDLDFLKDIFKKLPELETFVLNGRDCDHISDFSALRDICELTDLLVIELNFTACDKIHDISWLSPWGKGLSKLASLNMYFGRAWKVKDFEPLRTVGQFRKLEVLEFTISGVSDLGFFEDFAQLSELYRFRIIIMNEGEEELNNFDKLRSLGELKKLQEFDLQFNHIAQNRNLEPLAPLLRLQGLQNVQLSLGFSKMIENVDFFQSLDALPALKRLWITISWSSLLTSIKPLGSWLIKLTELESLTIFLTEMAVLPNAEGLQVVKQLPRLKKLKITMFGCKELRGLTGLKGLECLDLEVASFHFNGCQSLPPELARNFESRDEFLRVLNSIHVVRPHRLDGLQRDTSGEIEPLTKAAKVGSRPNSRGV